MNNLVISYLALRKAIGYLGIALPVVLSLGAWIFFQDGIQSSISSYYHTGMRGVFVGTLCAIGVFLLSYRGYDRSDNIVGNLCCVFAVGAALFPVAPDYATTSCVRVIGGIHLAFAALFFLTLICFSLFLFTKTDRSEPLPKGKRRRNTVYRACGYAMLICILLIAVYHLIPCKARSLLEVYNPVYWLEAIAVWAFGISWLTKGAAIAVLRD
jgi:hypothetical protein